MIWLSSYPHSGSSYMCHLLQQVYGVESSVHNRQPDQGGPLNFFEYPVVRTQLLPQDLDAFHRNQPSAYIVRDGRDAVAAAANHKKSRERTRTKLHYLMLQAAMADEESPLGGWSRHVIEWIKKADVILRYEDVMAHPVRECEKLRPIIKLPQPNAEKLPEAREDTLAFGPEYHANTPPHGSPKAKMPGWMHPIFWRYHGEVMALLGYQKNGHAPPEFDIAHRKQRIHEIFHHYPSHTIGERLKLVLAKFGII